MADCCNTTGSGFPSAGDMAKLSVNWPIIWAEIAAIQQAIIAAVSQCPPGCGGQGGSGIPGTGGPGSGTGGNSSVCIGGTTPMTFVTGIASVTVVDGGLGYYEDVPAIQFVPPYGVIPSSVATGKVITNGSQITSIIITNAGAGYAATGSTASVDSGTGVGAVLAVTVGPTGSIFGISVVSSGINYQASDVINVLRAIAPNPAYVDANVVIGGLDVNGGITAINVINPGTGYGPSLPKANIVSALSPTIPYITGVGFQSYVLTGINGAITGVIISYGGQGYAKLPPQLVIADSGTGAKTKVNLDGNLLVPPGNSVTTIDVLERGSNYTQNATAQVINPPTAPPPTEPAIVTLDIPENPYCTNPLLYYQVWAGTITNPAIMYQLDFIKSYFTNLGYSISIGVNPDTGNTLMWCICW